MTTLDRRNFLRRSAAAGIGASGLSLLMANAANAEKAGRGNTPIEAPDNGGYGELQTDPAGVLALPAGFSYVRFGETGDIMSDGIPTPGAHDGMAAFAGPGSHVRLVRNHERNTGAPFA
ncbi:MAG: DUF839 domain-containing protein, partial [Actinomycetota bacterium]|nr:DUF839 domain-containing protein [Actinomycetota bacterium]